VAVLVVMLSACGTPLSATQLRTPAAVSVGATSLQVPEVHLSADIRHADFTPASRVLVVLDVSARAPAQLDLRHMLLSIGGASGRETGELPIATGLGEPPVLLRDGEYVDKVELRAGQIVRAWVAFGGFLRRASREIPERVELTLADGTRLPLSVPGKTPPWQGTPVQASVGIGAWVQASADESSINLLLTDRHVEIAPLLLGTYWGIGVRSPRFRSESGGELVCCTLGFGLDLGWPVARNDQVALVPFVGGEASFLIGDDDDVTRKNWYGPMIGIELLGSPLLPRHGPFPVSYAQSPLGAVSLRAALVHWFGPDRDPPSFGASFIFTLGGASTMQATGGRFPY
jgi:hypothetical protein